MESKMKKVNARPNDQEQQIFSKTLTNLAERKKFDSGESQKEMDEFMHRKKLNKKPKQVSNLVLLPHLPKLLGWANLKKGSKRNISRLLKFHFQLDVGPDKIYRFVKKMNGGVWPNAKKSKDSK